MRKLLAWGCIVATLLVCTYFIVVGVDERRKLGLVPSGLGVTEVLYAKEDSWGFGPGGSETGVIVFALPAKIASEIQSQGIRHLAGLPADQSNRGLERPGSWHPTPALLGGSDMDANHVMSYEVSKYLNEYGFGIDIDATVEQQINATLSKSGSFLAYGRGGILIVAPSLQRVFYIYNG